MSSRTETWEETEVRAPIRAEEGDLLLVDQVAKLIELGTSPVNCAKAIRRFMVGPRSL